MYNNPGMQPGVPVLPTNPQPNPFGNAFCGAGSGLIRRNGLGAYGETIFGSSSEYVSNISRYFSDPQYYFQVNYQNVRNKLKVVLFPFLHRGMLGWFMQVFLLKVTLLSLGSGEAPHMDIVAYASYTFTGLSLVILGKIAMKYIYFGLLPWTCLCTGIFPVKTMKRVLFAEVKTYDSSRRHYVLLFIALAQFPQFMWLGNVRINWLL